MKKELKLLLSEKERLTSEISKKEDDLNSSRIEKAKVEAKIESLLQ